MTNRHSPHGLREPAPLPDLELPPPDAPHARAGAQSLRLADRALTALGWLAGRLLRGVALAVTATARFALRGLCWLIMLPWRALCWLYSALARRMAARPVNNDTGVAGTARMEGAAGKSAPGAATGHRPALHPAEESARVSAPHTPLRLAPRADPAGPTRRRAPRSGWPLAVRLLLLALLIFTGDIARYAVWPRVEPLARTNPGTTSFMEYRQEQWARLGRGPSYRQNWVGLGGVSRNLVLAVTIAEDDKFWRHEGFDLDGMEEAFLRNLEEGRMAAGGSTITQQLAKNLWFTPDKSLPRKAKEAIMAWRLEQALTKKRILELYLNVVEWGDGVFGAEAAARHHFGKSAAALTPWEAARLAAVLPNPLRWSPTGTSRGVQVRASIILSRMERRMGQD